MTRSWPDGSYMTPERAAAVRRRIEFEARSDATSPAPDRTIVDRDAGPPARHPSHSDRSANVGHGAQRDAATGRKVARSARPHETPDTGAAPTTQQGGAAPPLPVDPRYMRPCTHYASGAGRCGATPTRQFMNARLCREHAPAQPAPDPTLTAAAFRERRELLFRFRRAAA